MAIAADEIEQIDKIFNGRCSKNNLCPIKDITARFGDKWSMYTVLLLGRDNRVRFNELRVKIDGISQRMLTVTLRALEEDGIVSRTIYPEIPPRVEYKLTALGESLLHQLLALASWSENNFAAIVTARQQYALKSAVAKVATG